jgi:hypothetical protein
MKSSLVYKYRFDTRQHTAVPNTGVLAEFVTVPLLLSPLCSLHRTLVDPGDSFPLCLGCRKLLDWAGMYNSPKSKRVHSSGPLCFGTSLAAVLFPWLRGLD